MSLQRGKTLAQREAIREALAAGKTVLLCREGAAIRCRLEAGRVVYEEASDVPGFRAVSALEWLTLTGDQHP